MLYRVISNNRVRQVSSSHLCGRSEGVAYLEVDPEAVDSDHPVCDQRSASPKSAVPLLGKPRSAPLQPVPIPVPHPSLDGVSQATLDKLPSPQKSEVPTPREVRTPSPVVRSPYHKEVSPDMQMPAKVSPLAPANPARPLVLRRGRPIVLPRGLMDYVPYFDFKKSDFIIWLVNCTLIKPDGFVC